MEINDNALFADIKELLGRTPRAITEQWDLYIHTPAGNEISPLSVDMVKIMGDHLKQMSDIWLVTCTFGIGTFTQYLYPYKGRLKGTLVNTLGLSDVSSQTFNLVLVDTESEALMSGLPDLNNADASDNVKFKQVTFQLIDPEVEKLLTKEIRGSLRRVTPQSAIMTLMGDEVGVGSPNSPAISKEEWDSRTYSGLVGIDMCPAHNTQTYNQIVIPKTVKLKSLPKFIQEQCGIYSTGVGYYFQRGLWYIYPLYDTKRFDTVASTITVASVPPTAMPGTENTYSTSGKNVYVVSTGEVKHQDLSDSTQLTKGNGVRFTKATMLFDNPGIVKGNKAKFTSELVTSEFVSESRGQVNNVQTNNAIATDNWCKAMSDIAMTKGSIVEFVWENSNYRLLYPGMPAKYMYAKNDVVQSLKGVLCGVETTYLRVRPELTEKRMACASVLRFWIDRDISEIK